MNFDVKFIKKTSIIIIPIALQNLIFSSLNMVDTLMIGQLGATSIAGVSLSNQFFFVLMLLFFGISSGASIFTSQYWGTKEYDKINNILGVSLKIVFISGSIFTILGLFFSSFVLSLFTNNKNVIALGSQYLRIVSLSYIFSGTTFIFTAILRSIGHVKLPTIISAISLSLNTLINYLLIFGFYGFPKLGVQGAAIGTLIARIIELILILTVLKVNNHSLLKLKPSHFYFKGPLRRLYTKTVLPVVTNETAWALGTAVYSGIYGRISTGAVASYQIQQTITSLFLIFILGLGDASGIITGNNLGAGKFEKAYRDGGKFLKLSIILGLITSLAIFTISPLFVTLFKVDKSVIDTSVILINIFAVVLIFKALNITMIVGLFRAGGDTTTAMLMDIIGVWGIGIPLGLLGAFVLKYPVEYVYALVCVEEIAKVIYGLYRYKTKKWINNLTTL